MSDQPPGPSGGLSRDDVFRVLGALGAILTLVTAVLFYFGWRRSEAQSRVMGIDVSLFGFTSQDYVLRSISSLYLPLLLMAALGLVWVRLHGLLSGWLTRLAASPAPAQRDVVLGWARWVSVGAAVVGAGCLLFTLAAGSTDRQAVVDWLAQQLSTARWVIPLLLLVCVVVIAYCGWIRRVLTPERVERRSPWGSVLSGALAGVIVILSMFWILEEYAASVGRGYAQQLVESVDQLPRATVTSPAPLGIEAPGVTEEKVDDGVVSYRTTGLRLLARSGSKILLVHDAWQPRSGVVVVLPDSDSFSWQFSR